MNGGVCANSTIRHIGRIGKKLLLPFLKNSLATQPADVRDLERSRLRPGDGIE